MTYVYQIIIYFVPYIAFCVTVSNNFDTYLWSLEINAVVRYFEINFFVLFKFLCFFYLLQY